MKALGRAPVLAALGSSVAAACPVCGGGASQQSQSAYIDMSIILSALPLICIGAVVTWVARRMRARARMHDLPATTPRTHAEMPPPNASPARATR